MTHHHIYIRSFTYSYFWLLSLWLPFAATLPQPLQTFWDFVVVDHLDVLPGCVATKERICSELWALCVCVAAAAGTFFPGKTHPWNFGACILYILLVLSISGSPTRTNNKKPRVPLPNTGGFLVSTPTVSRVRIEL